MYALTTFIKHCTGGLRQSSNATKEYSKWIRKEEVELFKNNMT